MTALPPDAMADLHRLVAELEQRLESSFAAHDEAIARAAAADAENGRLIQELSIARERQGASADILGTIANASGDAEASLQRIAETTARLFDAASVTIRIADGNQWGQTIRFGAGSERIGKQVPVAQLAIGAPNLPSAVFRLNQQIHVPNLDDLGPEMSNWPGLVTARAAGLLTVAGTPLRREGKPIGILIVYRDRLAPFTDDELALQQSFSDQAAIAIENARLFNETREALSRQTATADILRIISQSPTDVQPVFDAIVLSAVRLLGCETSFIQRCDGAHFWTVARCGREGLLPVLSRAPVDPSANFPSRAIVEKKTLYLPDWSEIELPEFERRIQESLGYNSAVYLPLLREGECIAVLGIAGSRPRMFGENEIALAESFRDQALIAIENVRLFNETQEALERQTATADILKVIASSPSDVQPVFEAIATSANRLIDGFSTAVFRFIDGTVHLAAFTPVSPAADAALKGDFPTPVDEFEGFRLAQHGRPFPILDTEEVPHAPIKEIARLTGFRSMLFVPLMNGGVPIGIIVVTRSQPGPFADHHVQLLQTFADQAVIAIQNARLFDEVKQRTEDLSESLQQQTATADVLKVISRSAFDLQTVFQTLVESAAQLCRADKAAILRLRDNRFQMIATHGFPPEFQELMFARGLELDRGSVTGRAALERRPVQIPDILADPEFTVFESQRRGGFRTVLGVPLLREGNPIGALFLTRGVVELFTQQQIDLVTTFADQAVIAIENARLFDEVQAKTRDLSEALTYQTGSGNILKVIASSPTDVGPVLKAIVENACELCEAYDATVALKDDNDLRFSAHHGPIPIGLEKWPINRNWTAGRAFVDQTPVHVLDLSESADFPDGRELARRMGHRSILSVPLLRENESIGAIVLRRTEVHPFSDKQIALLQTFADQAVIAIGNVRLFEEVQARTRDLSEALTYQTGSGNILRVIASSPTDVKPVLTAIVESACELCEADDALATLRDGDELVFQAQHGSIPVVRDRQPIDREGAAGLAVIDRAPVHVHDLLGPEGEQFPRARKFARTTKVRTVLCVPLLREGESIGVIVLRRTEVRPFSDKQISLLQTFADQAVIAIGNVRLFEEVQQRTRELSESLEQQTATSEVLSVISRSAGDLEPVFQSMLENATRICGAEFGLMNLYEGGSFHTVGFHNVPPAFAASRQQSFKAHPDSDLGQMVHTKRVALIDDLRTRPAYLAGDPATVQLADLAGARTILIVPMVKDGEFVGTIGIYRLEVSPFSEKQIALLSSFASQAVIAIENTRLLKELRERTDDLTKSLDDLRTAQDRLVQTEKLASLGQLTAGIAHEIKNPLNFVNNFAALSAELTDELNDLLKQATITGKIREEVDELTGLLKNNLQKVVQHGQRADSIVKNMLLHSREGSGDHRPADINALVDESLNLAYHGARAERPDFNVTLQRDFDAGAGMIEVFPQEITRVFLNLISNGFYAVNKRKAENGTGFESSLIASTRNLGDAVEIRIRDNGTGIPQDVKDKMFNPFFTTKPAGEGTGLGLSMSHDIIVKQHGGTIDVDTEPGHFTEFRIVLPRTSKSSK